MRLRRPTPVQATAPCCRWIGPSVVRSGPHGAPVRTGDDLGGHGHGPLLGRVRADVQQDLPEHAPGGLVDDPPHQYVDDTAAGHRPRTRRCRCSRRGPTAGPPTALESPTSPNPPSGRALQGPVRVIGRIPVHVRETIARQAGRVEVNRRRRVQQRQQGLPASLGSIRIPELPGGPAIHARKAGRSPAVSQLVMVIAGGVQVPSVTLVWGEYMRRHTQNPLLGAGSQLDSMPAGASCWM